MNKDTKPILVIGGGISGMTAAVEAAEVGYRVILVEKESYLGGRVMRMHRYFPKMCPPTCGFEINTRRIKQNPRISVHTLTTVEEISGSPGKYKILLRKKPSYVVASSLIDDSITNQISSERNNDFNYGMDKTKALYIPHEMAYPKEYVIDWAALSNEDARKLSEISPPGAIDMNMTHEDIKIEVAAIIIATGWKPYDASRLDNLGFGKYENVITNIMMERLASQSGPTRGKIVRPSDGKKVENVAFVQCAGSRDVNHLPYCSAVCCMAAMKQARYIREKNDKAKVTIFYIDIRAIGRHEIFYQETLEDKGISFIKGKVANIEEEPGTKNMILDVEDTIARENMHPSFDMVVLSTGIVPNTENIKINSVLKTDEYGFVDESSNGNAIYAAGCVKQPCDVSRATKDSTAAALKAIQCLKKG
ncbi:MAG: FAD-dependent oxidoreductase [candidate division Zixibacteria bacterium]